MTTLAEAAALARAGNSEGGARLLAAAAQAGEAAAAFELAQWRMAGDHVRRDLGEARRLFGEAAAGGHPHAEAPYAALLASGAGGSGRRWGEALARLAMRAATDPHAAREQELVAAMDLDPEGDPRGAWTRREECGNPFIALVPGLFSAAECRYLADAASGLLRPAVVVHPRTGQLVADPVRRSSAAAFPLLRESPAIHALNRRIAAVTGTAWEQGEPLQVIAYGPGEEYRPHSDALPGAANQRAMTLLVWLSDGFAGGETDFPVPGRKFRGSIGDALVFANIDAGGQPDRRAVHAGLPVTRGRKLIASRWIRSAPLDLSGPPDRPL